MCHSYFIYFIFFCPPCPVETNILLRKQSHRLGLARSYLHNPVFHRIHFILWLLSYSGTLSVMATMVGNGIGNRDQMLDEAVCISFHGNGLLGEAGIHVSINQQRVNRRQTGFFSFIETTYLDKGKLWFQTSCSF